MKLLDAYLVLEKLMIEFDQSGDERRADLLRNAMDSIWHNLSDEDHKFLDSRNLKDLYV